LLAHAPRAVGLWVGRRLGDVAWIALRERRRVTRENLARAFGRERSGADLRSLARRSFQHLGMNVVEACVLLFRPRSVMLSRIEVHGREHLVDAMRRGKGILILGAHLGNWELLAPSHTLTGFPAAIVVRPLDHAILDRLVAWYRRRDGVELIPKRRAVRGILEALGRGHMVGILLDQNASRAEGVFAPFFGVPASTSKGLAVIALRTGAPVVPAFCRRLPGGRHRIDFEAELRPGPDRDVTRYTTIFNGWIEAAIRRAPEQWFWMHKRWRTRPTHERACELGSR
jgi:KDO2-lipid IV(A) lauroyltransferase